jgi:DNA polymerase III subunit gamma/tau
VFENLLGQDEAIGSLRADLESGRLPPAILLSGPLGSGKGTAALELARALSCTLAESHALGGAEGKAFGDSNLKPQVARWNCPCPSCARHRALVHPDLLLLGPRSFPEEIPAALEILGRSPGSASAYFFLRAARKLAKRFDATLYEGEEPRLAKAAPLLRDLEELLDALAPDKARDSDPAGAKARMDAATKAAAVCAKLEAFVPGAPPVFMIRNVEFWARLAPMGMRKAVVIENAERMQEGSRNALLKILEEPPDSVRFVLTSSRRSALMKTILSRVRSYHFAMRGPEATATVIERVFRSSERAASVEAFLAARRPFPPSVALELAQAFLGAALSERPDRGALAPPLAALAARAEASGEISASRTLAKLAEATKDFGQKDESYASSFRSFLAALCAALGASLRAQGMGADALGFLERASSLIRSAVGDYENLNRNPGLVAESLFYALRETGVEAARPSP